MPDTDLAPATAPQSGRHPLIEALNLPARVFVSRQIPCDQVVSAEAARTHACGLVGIMTAAQIEELAQLCWTRIARATTATERLSLERLIAALHRASGLSQWREGAELACGNAAREAARQHAECEARALNRWQRAAPVSGAMAE